MLYAGLIPFKDYLLGTAEKAFKNSGDFLFLFFFNYIQWCLLFITVLYSMTSNMYFRYSI